MHMINLQTKLHVPNSTISLVTADLPKMSAQPSHTHFIIYKNITFSKAAYFSKPYYHASHMFR